LNGRPKSKKFGLVDTKGLKNTNSTDNLLQVPEKKKEKKKVVGKKKSTKPAEVLSDQDEHCRRDREE
jgi:hypothetical protein